LKSTGLHEYPVLVIHFLSAYQSNLGLTRERAFSNLFRRSNSHQVNTKG